MKTQTKRPLKFKTSVKERQNAVVATKSRDSSSGSTVDPSPKPTTTEVGRAVPYTIPQRAPHFMVHEKSF